MQIPLTDIDDDALPRDRTALCGDALAELQSSIATSGLRQPIEVFATENGPAPYALISGYRRLTAYRALNELNKAGDYANIKATVRQPADLPAALHAMVEENDIRADTSPWERAAIAVATHHQGFFDTVDAALQKLYPFAARQKRAKLRAIAEVIDTLDGLLIDPETLTERKLLRIANVLRLGWTDIILAALHDCRAKTSREQWQTLLPTLEEAETLVITGRSTNPNTPRRLAYTRCGLVMRREKTPQGYLLHLTGQRAKDPVVSEVLDHIERMFTPD